MILLSDNDLIIKLAQCDLIGEALESLEATRKDCFVLSTIKYSLRLNDPDKSIARYVGSTQAFERINELLDTCQVLSEAPIEFDLLEHLNEIPSIDAGEQALFLHAKDNDSKAIDYRILTGDKRALRAICNYEQLEAFAFLRTKIVCLESCMMDMIDVVGFDQVNQKVIAAREQVGESKYDQVLRAAFGADRNKDHCLECLSNYSSDIRWLLSY
ncbi:hypothetical protein [Pseudomonas sp. 2835]|uniref:hypothetical protein n=1 Tax=Pseudomonas sp. 2835 TaxID=3156451 RepID=UPI003D2148BF